MRFGTKFSLGAGARTLCLFAMAASLASASPARGQACDITYVGGDANGPSPTGDLYPSLSADGRYASYLQSGFPSLAWRHDRQTGTKVLISALSDGTPFNGGASTCTLSADGRYAVFLAAAANTGTLGAQVFYKDLESGALEVVTVAADGTPVSPGGSLPDMGPTPMSQDGRRIVFASSSPQLVPGKTTFWNDAFVRDLSTGTTVRLLGSGGSEPDKPVLGQAAISANGRFVAFASRATNLVLGDTNQQDDVFVQDLDTGRTRRISTSASGAQANDDSQDPVISSNGRLVAFVSRATNLVPGDTNGLPDVFVRDLATGRIQRANVASDGTQADGPSSRTPRISASGQYVLFHSVAANLTPGASGGHLYLRDLHAQATEIVVAPSAGSLENDVCSLSGDARTIAFASTLPFGSEDTNAGLDTFVRSCDTSVR